MAEIRSTVLNIYNKLLINNPNWSDILKRKNYIIDGEDIFRDEIDSPGIIERLNSLLHERRYVLIKVFWFLIQNLNYNPRSMHSIDLWVSTQRRKFESPYVSIYESLCFYIGDLLIHSML